MPPKRAKRKTTEAKPPAAPTIVHETKEVQTDAATLELAETLYGKTSNANPDGNEAHPNRARDLSRQLSILGKHVSKLTEENSQLRRRLESIISKSRPLPEQIRVFKAECEARQDYAKLELRIMAALMKAKCKMVEMDMEKEYEKLLDKCTQKDARLAKQREEKAELVELQQKVADALDTQARNLQIVRKESNEAIVEARELDKKLKDRLYLADNKKCTNCAVKEQVKNGVTDQLADKINEYNKLQTLVARLVLSKNSIIFSTRRQRYSAGASTMYDSGTNPPPQFDTSDLGSPKKVWSLLCEKDEKYSTKRDPLIFQHQRKINPNMRCMLIDWLMEVCADKTLHRETFHLTIDYIDRYLCCLKDQEILPQRLQLIGATGLVIASKIEEICPLKLSEIAEYTDGCCTAQDLRDMEEVMLQQLEWNCYPITAVHWLALYMQLMNTNGHQVILTGTSFKARRSSIMTSIASPRPHSLNVSIVLDEEEDESVGHEQQQQIVKVKVKEEPPTDGNENHATSSCGRVEVAATSKKQSKKRRMQLAHIGTSPKVLIHTASYVGHRTYSSGHVYPDQRCTVPKLIRGEFVRMAMILDLVTMDAGSLLFHYRELATAVLLCSYQPKILVCQITGFTSDKIRPARKFVEPFVRLFDQLEPTGSTIPCLPTIPHDDRHNIQTYIENCLHHLESIKQMRLESEERRKVMQQRGPTGTTQTSSRKRKFGPQVNHVGRSHEI